MLVNNIIQRLKTYISFGLNLTSSPILSPFLVGVTGVGQCFTAVTKQFSPTATGNGAVSCVLADPQRPVGAGKPMQGLEGGGEGD